MNNTNIMQQALADQWQELPNALRLHYQSRANRDIGVLNIEYPMWMQPLLSMLHLLGALINRRGEAVTTIVVKHMEGNFQHWSRTMTYADGKTVQFKSRWVYGEKNEVIEYINRYIGLCMAVYVKDGRLYYEGRHYVFKLFKIAVPIPEWLLLGHASIVETALDDNRFQMDFRLHHPVMGQVYRYSGIFHAEA